MKTIQELLGDNKIVPVVVINDVKDTIPTMQALQNGGIPVAEITFRTSCAKEAIRIASETFPDMVIGAGTVTVAQQANDAVDAGAKFIVSPGFSDGVCDVCRMRGVPYLPGCVTPTEIMHAMDKGLTTVKFFPAGVYGGLKAIKALSAPFPKMKFMPTGGVDLENLAEFLSCPCITAVGGSFMMKGDIEGQCRKTVEIVKAVSVK